jgi:transcription initiation factor TFIID TATA-box-binding protein
MSGKKRAKPKIIIKNVVSSFTLDRELDLEKVHSAFKEESLFDEQIFNYGVVVLRVKEPKMSFLIYRTGKVICTGAESPKVARQSDEYLLRRFKDAGFEIGLKSRAKVQNIVGVLDLGTALDLNSIASRMPAVEYEPEQFPGAVYRLFAKNFRATILIFGSGKVICLGCQREGELVRIFRKISLEFKNFRS